MELAHRTKLHCTTPGHNKLYIIDIYKEYKNAQNQYELIVHYGGLNASSYVTQTKRAGLSWNAVLELVVQLIKEKTNKGYEVTPKLATPKLDEYLDYFDFPLNPTKPSKAVSFSSPGNRANKVKTTQQITNKPPLRKIRL